MGHDVDDNERALQPASHLHNAASAQVSSQYLPAPFFSATPSLQLHSFPPRSDPSSHSFTLQFGRGVSRSTTNSVPSTSIPGLGLLSSVAASTWQPAPGTDPARANAGHKSIGKQKKPGRITRNNLTKEQNRQDRYEAHNAKYKCRVLGCFCGFPSARRLASHTNQGNKVRANYGEMLFQCHCGRTACTSQGITHHCKTRHCGDPATLCTLDMVPIAGFTQGAPVFQRPQPPVNYHNTTMPLPQDQTSHEISLAPSKYPSSEGQNRIEAQLSFPHVHDSQDPFRREQMRSFEPQYGHSGPLHAQCIQQEILDPRLREHANKGGSSGSLSASHPVPTYHSRGGSTPSSLAKTSHTMGLSVDDSNEDICPMLGSMRSEAVRLQRESPSLCLCDLPFVCPRHEDEWCLCSDGYCPLHTDDYIDLDVEQVHDAE